MQGAMNRMLQACDNYEKSEIVYHPAPGKPYSALTITVNGQKLHAVDRFTYLGSALFRAVHIDD